MTVQGYRGRTTISPRQSVSNSSSVSGSTIFRSYQSVSTRPQEPGGRANGEQFLHRLSEISLRDDTAKAVMQLPVDSVKLIVNTRCGIVRGELTFVESRHPVLCFTPVVPSSRCAAGCHCR